MTENKRFTDNGFEAIVDQSFTDNLTKKTYYVDYFDEIVDLCNSLWEQTKRFEKHNQELVQRSITYEDKIDELKNKNKKLKKVIDLLNNNEKLEYYKKENYHLKKRIAELEKEVDYKKNTDACRVISDFIDYKKDVTNIIDKELDYWYIQKDKGLISTCTVRVIDVLKRIKKEL